MSFSTDVKNELARIEVPKKCCEKAELLGLLRMSGAIVLQGLNVGIHFSTENAALARRVLQMLKANYGVKTEVITTRSRRLKKNNRYQIRVIPSPEVGVALKELQLLPSDERQHNLLASSCCRKAFLRGVFMAGGSISKPASDYHLEIVTENQDFAKVILKVMQGFSLSSKMTDRKNDYIVYVKDGNSITNFLSVIGAHNSLMEFENVRIVKEMRNNVNRVVNCETANLNKTIKAAVLQVEAIKFIQKNMGLAKLPDVLQKTARLRLKNPEASLNELVDLTEEEIGKSGLNHRFKKILVVAEKLGMRIDEPN